jgi:glycosyltransferase involved in cell wall biosynthesis
MSRPRILYVLSSLAANDLGDEIVTILGKLSRARFEPTVVTLGGREDLKRRIDEMQVRQSTLGLAGPIGAWLAVGRVRRLITEVGPDVVHGFGSWAGAVAQLAAPKDVAVVRSVTRPPTHEKDLRGRVLQHLERRSRSRVATYYVVPNEGSRGLALRAYAAADGHIRVLPRCIDVEDVRDRVKRTGRQEARDQLGIASDSTAVALLSDFESASRMDQILSGFALAVRERPSLRLFMVGAGRHEGSTHWKAQELGLGESVAFLGRGTEAGPIWSAADLAIDASPWASWSRSALVAIAAGLPTLKRQEGVGGWSEELAEKLPMISGEPERFAAEVIGIAQDAGALDEVREQGADIVLQVDATRVAAELGDLYRSLAS